MQTAKRSTGILSFVLLAMFGASQQAVSMDTQRPDGSNPYPTMAPVDQYLMANRQAEIALARSAAPASISREATVLVLGRQGYETAVEGTNGFVCVVARGWMGPFDWPEFWNPKIMTDTGAVWRESSLARQRLSAAFAPLRVAD